MIKFLNDCREGEAPKYFCQNKSGASYVFSIKDDLNKHLESEKVFYGANYASFIRSGEIEDLKPEEGEERNYVIVPLLSSGSGLRGTDENYVLNNPFRTK